MHTLSNISCLRALCVFLGELCVEIELDKIQDWFLAEDAKEDAEAEELEVFKT